MNNIVKNKLKQQIILIVRSIALALMVLIVIVFVLEQEVEASRDGKLEKAFNSRYPVYVHFQGGSYSNGLWPLTDGNTRLLDASVFRMRASGGGTIINTPFGPQLDGSSWLNLDSSVATNHLLPGTDAATKGNYTIIIHLFYAGGGMFLSDKGSLSLYTYDGLYDDGLLAPTAIASPEENIRFIEDDTLNFTPVQDRFMRLHIVKAEHIFRVYINGVLQGEYPAESTVIEQGFLSGLNAIGGPGLQGSNNNLRATISEFVVFEKALSVADLKKADELLISNNGVIIKEITTPYPDDAKSFNVGTDVIIKGKNFGNGTQANTVLGSTLFIGASKLQGKFTLWEPVDNVRAWADDRIVFTLSTNYKAGLFYKMRVQYKGFSSRIFEVEVLDSIKYKGLSASERKHVTFTNLFFPLSFQATESDGVEPFNRTYFTYDDVTKDDKFTITVFSKDGRLVNNLLKSEPLRFGTSISWNGKNNRSEIVSRGEYLILTVIEEKKAFYSRVFVMPNIEKRKFYYDDFLLPPSDKLE